MSWATRALAVLAVLLSVGCASDPVEVQQDPRPSFAVAATCSEASGQKPDNFTDHWSCGQTIRINLTALSGKPGLLEDARQAIRQWNDALSARRLGLPVLSDSTGSPVITVNLTTGDEYCGGVIPTDVRLKPTGINMLAFAAGKGCGTFYAVFLHELSHVYGFHDTWEKNGEPGVSTHCARSLPGGKAVNEGVCQHEIETLYYKYGLRGADVSRSKHIITGVSGLGPRTIFVGATATLAVSGFVFNRGQCGSEGPSCLPAPSSLSYTWTPSSSAISLTGSGPSRTVKGVSPGTPTVTVVPATTAFEIASELTGNRPTITVQAVPPPARPTLLTASGITSTSAQINWTNGDTSTGTTTFLEYRITGQSAWSKANGGVGLPAGQSSYLLTGLQCATSYDVNIYHRKNGVNSTALTLTLFSTAACQTPSLNPPSAFWATSCTTSGSGKIYVTYGVAWTAGSNPSSSLFHIVESNSSNPATGTVIRSGPITTVTSSVGPYLVTTNAAPRYFWVRHVNGSQSSVLVPIQGNPLQIKSPGCLL